MHAYCLFCETQKCGTVAHIIETVYGVRCISPRIIQRKWVKGECREVSHDWLPGYVFLYSDQPIPARFPVSGIIRLLGNGELKGQDYIFASTLLNQNGVMGTIRLAEEGDRCYVDDPVWKPLQGTLVKVDRGRRRCCVSFEFAKQQRTVWVGYELVRRAEPANTDGPAPASPDIPSQQG